MYRALNVMKSKLEFLVNILGLHIILQVYIYGKNPPYLVAVIESHDMDQWFSNLFFLRKSFL